MMVWTSPTTKPGPVSAVTPPVWIPYRRFQLPPPPLLQYRGFTDNMRSGLWGYDCSDTPTVHPLPWLH